MSALHLHAGNIALDDVKVSGTVFGPVENRGSDTQNDDLEQEEPDGHSQQNLPAHAKASAG